MLCAQPAKLKFKKEGLIVFFQEGTSSDTVFKTRHNRFYLLVPDTLKSAISIHVENGRFQTTSNDSIVQISYMDKLRYESFYQKKEEEGGSLKKTKAYEFITLINGTSTLESGKMQVRIVYRQSSRPLVENNFLYRE